MLKGWGRCPGSGHAPVRRDAQRHTRSRDGGVHAVRRSTGPRPARPQRDRLRHHRGRGERAVARQRRPGRHGRRARAGRLRVPHRADGGDHRPVGGVLQRRVRQARERSPAAPVPPGPLGRGGDHAQHARRAAVAGADGERKPARGRHLLAHGGDVRQLAAQRQADRPCRVPGWGVRREHVWVSGKHVYRSTRPPPRRPVLDPHVGRVAEGRPLRPRQGQPRRERGGLVVAAQRHGRGPGVRPAGPARPHGEPPRSRPQRAARPGQRRVEQPVPRLQPIRRPAGRVRDGDKPLGPPRRCRRNKRMDRRGSPNERHLANMACVGGQRMDRELDLRSAVAPRAK
jgi:hypothetical protein